MTYTRSNEPYSVVVGVDFRPSCEAAIFEALRIAGDHPNSEVHAVHVLDPHHGSPLRSVRIQQQAFELAEVPDRLRVYVMEHASSLPRAGNTSLGVHVRFGKPAAGLIQMAADVHADLIVVGTHGRERHARLHLGSVAEELVRTAPCPVLVSRPLDYAGLTRSETVEPPCPDCVAVRQRTGGEQWWCDRHERERAQLHTYSSVSPVRWTLGPADVHGPGTHSAEL